MGEGAKRKGEWVRGKGEGVGEAFPNLMFIALSLARFFVLNLASFANYVGLVRVCKENSLASLPIFNGFGFSRSYHNNKSIQLNYETDAGTETRHRVEDVIIKPGLRIMNGRLRSAFRLRF